MQACFVGAEATRACLQVFFARPDAKRHAGEACPGEKAMPLHVVKPPLRTMLARCAVPVRFSFSPSMLPELS
jgi:hypothetical protein